MPTKEIVEEIKRKVCFENIAGFFYSVALLQKLGKNGKWTKGRTVALSTLSSKVNTLPYLSEQDKHVVGAIQKSQESSWGYYGGSNSFDIQQSQALPALVDHPLIFWENNPTTRLELVLGSPELHVEKHTNNYKLTLSPEMDEGEMLAGVKWQTVVLDEAQSQQALEALSAGQESAGGGQQHIQVLAEITRLRRFCCNPELVVPDMGIASSKLKVFTTIVQELLENNHKALVFSQFVGHLALIRKRLDSLGISYQYLDGSTTPQQRKIRVKNFQAGKGDLFLISLKAGGSGLNLTAADYVIHMDPWWNPAVEDQTSDRAHRIGQLRPVTIYRLVVKDSIEEKIVALHKEKRALADSLLTGSDMSGKISTSQLLKLLRNE